ncbi:Type-1 restriction enzyme EcoKI specificity protein [subsurface metagenome]
MSLEKDSLPELPRGWVWTVFGEISIISAGGPAPQGKEYFENGTYPFVRVRDMGNLGTNVYLNTTGDYINDKAVAKLRLFPKGSVLFTKSGMSILLNQRAILGQDMYIVSHIGAAIPLGAIPSEYAYYWLKTIDFKLLTHATTLPSLQLSKVQLIPVPLPPLSEQKGIVARIEELFTKLDAGIEALKKMKVQLKRYRQAVLKHAFEGKLTAEWREKNKDKLEPASVLLERIAKEREKTAKGKAKKLPPLDTSNLPELPEDWEWTSGENVFWFITSGSRGWAKYYSKAGAMFIRMGNLDHDSINLDLTNMQRVDLPPTAEGKRTKVQPNDMLISITADVGMTALVPDTIREAYVNQHVALARAVPVVNRAFIAWYIASREGGQKQFLRLQRGATKTGLGLDDIRNLILPIASILEQNKIVEEIERHFSIADQVEQTIEQGLNQSDRLRQSILKKAFEGKLVAQDPEDEPAEKLLERIKAEKGKAQAEQRGKRKARKKKDLKQLELIANGE